MAGAGTKLEYLILNQSMIGKLSPSSVCRPEQESPGSVPSAGQGFSGAGAGWLYHRRLRNKFVLLTASETVTCPACANATQLMLELFQVGR
jgi:hypothetical protein